MSVVNLSQYPIESNRTPIQAHTFSRSNGWWRAIVKSEDAYGNERTRLYLWRNSDGKNWNITHKWNVDPDRWPEEKAVVKKYLNKLPSQNPPHFPIQHYTVVGGETITKSDRWWTAIVQYEDEYNSTHKTRLYMWDISGAEPKGTGYKWNISTDTWGEEATVADGFLAD